MQDTNPLICVLVASCDSYSDVWQAFAAFFDRFWIKCPYRIYLSSNFLKFEHPRIKSVLAKEKSDWSNETLEVFRKIPEEIVIYLQDDYLLTHAVNQSELESLIETVRAIDADYLRIYPCPGPDISINSDKRIGRIVKSDSIYTSLQAAIWKKSSFISLLVPGESAWNFEKNGSKRAHERGMGFYSIKRSLFPLIKTIRYPINYFCTAVVRGQWQYDAARMCRKAGIRIDSELREIETYQHYIKRRIYEFAAATPQPFRYLLIRLCNLLGCSAF
jgi:hypothetical protein